MLTTWESHLSSFPVALTGSGRNTLASVPLTLLTLALLQIGVPSFFHELSLVPQPRAPSLSSYGPGCLLDA